MEILSAFTNNTFTGHYPVGTAAVVIALNRAQAARILTKELKEKHGLSDPQIHSKDMKEMPTDRTYCRVLCDGNY